MTITASSDLGPMLNTMNIVKLPMTWRNIVGGICLGVTANFQGRYKIFYLNMGRMVTHKQKIRKIPMPTWVVQRVEALAVSDGWDIANVN